MASCAVSCAGLFLSALNCLKHTQLAAIDICFRFTIHTTYNSKYNSLYCHFL